MINAIIIDHETSFIAEIEGFCKHLSNRITLDKGYDNLRHGLRHLNKFPVDLLFVNTDMPEVKNVNWKKEIKQDTLIVFIGTHTKSSLENRSANMVDFLTKPLSLERFKDTVEKIYEQLTAETQTENGERTEHIFLRSNGQLLKINFSDIVFVEGMDDYIKVHLQGQKSIMVYMNLRNIAEKLPKKDFMRVHRSFIVAKNKVESLKEYSGKKWAVLIDGRELPLGGMYAEEVIMQFQMP